MKAEEFAAGALIEVPGEPAHTRRARRPYCLLIRTVVSVSKATGAVDLVGEVRSLAGTTTRRKPLVRRLVTSPDRVTLRAAAPDDKELGETVTGGDDGQDAQKASPPEDAIGTILSAMDASDESRRRMLRTLGYRQES